MSLLGSIALFPLVSFKFLTHRTLANAYGLSYFRLRFSFFIHLVNYFTFFLAEMAILFFHCLCNKKQRLQYFLCLNASYLSLSILNPPFIKMKNLFHLTLLSALAALSAGSLSATPPTPHSATPAPRQDDITHAGEDKYKPTVESLRQYQCPQWIQDAKFGIYCHWNAQSASKSSNNGWYARDMYIQGSRAYKDHLKHWGHPSKVGYKDVIQSWVAPKFDAEQWIQLFKEAGAKYVLTMAVHHDNFDLWDSKYQPKWNSMHYGPKKDVCKEMRDAALKHGLRWGVSTHLARSYSWFQTNKGADQSGPLKGVPYDGNNPAYQDLYLEKPDFSQLGKKDDMLRHPLHSPKSWKDLWKNRMIDIIDHYHPDFFYFDGASPFMDDNGQSGLDVIAHYYNHNAARHQGNNEGVMVIKDITRHGHYFPGISSIVLERRRSNKINASPRITEQSVGPWFQIGKPSYRSSQSLIHEMIDVISKNCIFQLNIPPRGDGSIDQACVKILADFGAWFKVNGSAIYETKPWHQFGEGNIRFTTKGNQINAICLNHPGKELLIVSGKNWNKKDIKSIELLGEGPVEWEITDKGLLLKPTITSKQLAYTFQITCARPASEMPSQKVPQPSAKKDNEKASRAGVDGNGNGVLQSQ